MLGLESIVVVLPPRQYRGFVAVITGASEGGFCCPTGCLFLACEVKLVPVTGQLITLFTQPSLS